MKKYYILLFLLLLFSVCRSSNKLFIVEEVVSCKKGDTILYQPNWENIAEHYQFPQWFVDAKFGIFIHWGVYSIPAFGNEWYARAMYNKENETYNYHRKKYGDQSKFGYKDFIPMFKAEKFNPVEWVKIFKASGAKYVVPVAEHHDGFAMYDSHLNEWNSVKMGPKKDILGLLKQAIEEEGLIFGLSSHRAENAWFYDVGMDFVSDVQDTTISLYGRRLPREKYDKEFAQDWFSHTCELVDKYKPQLVWFDWTVNNPVLMPYFNKFLAYYYNCALGWKKQVVVNTKQGYPTNIHVWDVERGKSGKMMKYPWQTDTSAGMHSWCYIDGEENKTPEQIVHDLIDIVSKNGNLLLNIGPRADGTITEEQKSVLLSIGDWLRINGDAIYGTRCWKKYGEGETISTVGSFSDNKATPYTVNDIRFTTKENVFYAIVLDWGNEVLIKSLDRKAISDAQIISVEMLGSDDKIEWKQTDEGLKLSFPSHKPCEFAYSFKITFDKVVGENLESEAVDEVMKHGI